MPDTYFPTKPDDKIRNLRTQAGQASAWQTTLLEIVERLEHENRAMKKVIIGMKKDLDALVAQKVEM